MQPLSGAPGYLPGFPLLASLAATAPAPTGAGVLRQAVSRLRGGLQLPGPGPAGRCSPSRVYSTPVGWGYNLTSTCSVGLTLSQLRALCTANTPARPLADVLGAEWLGNLTSQQLLLGVWGNSDPANIAAWLPLAASGWPPATDAVWDEAASTCHNMATGLQVRDALRCCCGAVLALCAPSSLDCRPCLAASPPPLNTHTHTTHTRCAC
jgi:hypothetical protein